MKNASEDPKQKAILAAAWTTFSLYGFRKTSMDDIARAAAVSRPALYLHYRNKEDIFRTLVQSYYEEAAAGIEAALAAPGTPSEQLAAAFGAQGGALMESMLTSPHGMELLDSGKTTASDIVETGEAEFAAVYARWLARLADSGKARLSGTPQETADTITAALKGIKMAARNLDAYQAQSDILAAVIGAGLAADS